MVLESENVRTDISRVCRLGVSDTAQLVILMLVADMTSCGSMYAESPNERGWAQCSMHCEGEDADADNEQLVDHQAVGTDIRSDLFYTKDLTETQLVCLV